MGADVELVFFAVARRNHQFAGHPADRDRRDRPQQDCLLLAASDETAKLRLVADLDPERKNSCDVP